MSPVERRAEFMRILVGRRKSDIHELARDLNVSPRTIQRDIRVLVLDGKDYPVNWKVNFDENLHQDGSYYYFSRCPICEFCNREGIGELMPALCATDEIMFRLQHGKLYRKHTIANGDSICDYWVVGDKIKNPK